MEKRREWIFKQIIKIYTTTAEPVGSLYLAVQSQGKFSSATIRNEMTGLEEEGLVSQPHISAGRIPTENGFRFYLENFVASGKIDKDFLETFKKEVKNQQDPEEIKRAARLVSKAAKEAVVVAFNPNQFYYTGISYLFSKPEFREQVTVFSLSQILDHCEKVMPQVLELIDKKNALLGSENPFGKFCSFIAMPFTFGNESGLFGILGPMRMDYQKNLNLVTSVKKIFI